MNDIIIARKLISIKDSANKRKIPFNMSFSKVKQLMTRKTCYYTGVKFDGHYVRSFDRVDNNLGYIDTNVVACTVQINGFKANLTIKAINMLTKKINTFIEKQK